MDSKIGDDLSKHYMNTLARRMGINQNEVAHINQPIEKIVTELIALKKENWVAYAFLHEPLQRRLSKDLQKDLYIKSVECGRLCAEETIKRCGTNKLYEITSFLGLSIDKPKEPTNCYRILFADYIVPNTIHIYMDGVERGMQLLSSPKVAEAFGSSFSIFDVLLGHEIYHVIESRNADRIWTRTYEVPLWKMGSFSYKAHISCLNEIAAMSFTRCLNGLAWNPYILNVLLTYGYSPQSAIQIYGEII
jgi:hypothetical protein